MTLNDLSAVSLIYLATLIVILTSMIVVIGPRPRKHRARTIVSSGGSKSSRPSPNRSPTSEEILQSMETIITKLRLEGASDESDLQFLAFLNQSTDWTTKADIQEFIVKLIDIAQQLACVRYLIEHTKGADRIALGNIKTRTLKQLVRFEEGLDQLRNKYATSSQWSRERANADGDVAAD